MSVHAWFADWSLTWWPSLGNHLWQATLFGLAALLVTAFLKTSRSQTRYLILLVALLKFAVPSMLFVAGVGWLGFQPAVLAPVDGTPESSAGTATELALRIATPLPSTPPPQTIKTGAPHAHSEIYCGLSIFWLLGFASFVAAWAKRRVAVLSEVRQAEVLRDGPLSDAVVEVSRQLGVGQRVRVGISSHSAQPGVWGIRRPIVILPGGITSRLTRGELRSLLTHELAHVKRYDNLVSYFQMLVRSFFWFHPLVWCIDRRLLTEREAACDESVIRRGEAAEDYVAGLLKACRLSVTAPVAGLSRITESNLKTRVERIMSIPHRNPNVFWQRCLVGSALTAAVATSVIVGLLSNRPVLAEISVLAIPRWSGYSDPRLGCKVFVFLSRSMLRSLPFGSLNAARSPRSSSLEGFSPTRLRVVPSSATQRLFSVAAVARYPPGTGSAQIRPSISANSLRLRCPSANSSQ